MKNLILLFTILMLGVVKAQTSTMTMSPNVVKGEFYAPATSDVELNERRAVFTSRTYTTHGGYIWNYTLENGYILRFEYSRHECLLYNGACPDTVGRYRIVIRTPHDSSRVIGFDLEYDSIIFVNDVTIVYSGTAQVGQHEGDWGFDQEDVVAIEAVFRY